MLLVYMNTDCLIVFTYIDAKKIEGRKKAITDLWTSLRETIDLRSMALAVAREIHTFNRDADDVKERVQVAKPEAIFVSMFQCSQ